MLINQIMTLVRSGIRNLDDICYITETSMTKLRSTAKTGRVKLTNKRSRLDTLADNLIQNYLDQLCTSNFSFTAEIVNGSIVLKKEQESFEDAQIKEGKQEPLAVSLAGDIVSVSDITDFFSPDDHPLASKEKVLETLGRQDFLETLDIEEETYIDELGFLYLLNYPFAENYNNTNWLDISQAASALRIQEKTTKSVLKKGFLRSVNQPGIIVCAESQKIELSSVQRLYSHLFSKFYRHIKLSRKIKTIRKMKAVW